jgi:hypothetical protein
MRLRKLFRFFPAAALLSVALVCQAQNQASCTFSLYRLTSGQNDVTHPFGVNDFNNSVGELDTEPSPGQFVFRGFIHFSNGGVSLFTAPHSSSTAFRDRSDSGVNIGNFFDTVTQKPQGFALSGSTFVTISHPNAPRGTNVYRINKFGSIVGVWFDSVNSPHGFKLVNKTFLPIMFPNSVETTPMGINDHGEIVGTYNLASGRAQGFTFLNGVYHTLNFPNAPTSLRGISNAGTIVGIDLATESGQSFLRKSNGVFEFIVVPNAAVTDVTGISLVNGIITGRAFFNSDGTWHGFTAKCQ